MNSYTKTDTPKILFEDGHILVCVKPHGIAAQSRQIGRPDMVNLLKNHIHRNTAAKGEPYLAVIHRLDQPVEGILVFAKSPTAARELNRQMKQQGFGKYYRALVEGRPPKTEDTLEDYMVKDNRTNLSCICSRNTDGAKAARLHYTIVPEEQRYFSSERLCPQTKNAMTGNGTISSETSEFPDLLSCTELDIRLYTGRHHQIRLQMANMGCPIVGDTKYNPRYSHASQAPFAWHKICLCAYRLDFCHPVTGKPLHFQL